MRFALSLMSAYCGYCLHPNHPPPPLPSRCHAQPPLPSHAPGSRPSLLATCFAPWPQTQHHARQPSSLLLSLQEPSQLPMLLQCGWRPMPDRSSPRHLIFLRSQRYRYQSRAIQRHSFLGVECDAAHSYAMGGVRHLTSPICAAVEAALEGRRFEIVASY